MNHPRTDALHKRPMTPTEKTDEYAAMKLHAEQLEQELAKAQSIVNRVEQLNNIPGPELRAILGDISAEEVLSIRDAAAWALESACNPNTNQ